MWCEIFWLSHLRWYRTTEVRQSLSTSHPLVRFSGKTDPAFQTFRWGLRALLAYRGGDAQKALEYIQKGEEANGPVLAKAQNLLIQAMAQHHLGKHDKAKESFTAATKLIDMAEGVPSLRAHADLLMTRLMTTEYRQLAGDKEAVNIDKELRVLEKFLGTRDTKYVGLEDLATESTYERILGGRYIQRTGAIRAAGTDNQILELMTYSPGEKCYRMWTHFSDPRGPAIEHRGTWDEVTQTMTWEAKFKSGATRTTTTRFESETMMKSRISGKDANGNLRADVTETVTVATRR